MARKKYQSDRMLRSIPGVAAKPIADVSPLFSAQTARSQQISSLVDTMKGFVQERFETQAKESAAKIALENDPLKVIDQTKDSLKIVDKLSFALASTKLTNNLLRTIDAEISKQAIESEMNQDNPDDFNFKVDSIINKELQNIRQDFDSPLFEANFRNDIAKSINKTKNDYKDALIKTQLQDLNYVKTKELEANVLLDVKGKDFNFTQTKKHIKNNPNIYNTEMKKGEAISTARNLAYKSMLDVIKANKNMTNLEKEVYRQAFQDARTIADQEGDLPNFILAETILETLDGKVAESIKTQAELFNQGSGSKDSTVGQMIDIIRSNPQVSFTEISDQLLSGVTGKEKAKQKKALNEINIKYRADPLHYEAQIDGVSLDIDSNGRFIDDEAITYIQKKYNQLQSFDSAYNMKQVVAISKNIDSPIKQYEFYRNYFGQFDRMTDYTTEQVLHNFLDKAKELPKEDKKIVEKMAYLMTYGDDTVSTMLQGIDERQKDKDPKSSLNTLFKKEHTSFTNEVQKRNVAMKPSTVNLYADIAKDYIAGLAKGDINYAPSGDEIKEAVDAAFGIVRNMDGDIIHGYSEDGDGNFWDANSVKMQFENKQITKEEMNDIVTENLNSNTIAPFLLTEERGDDGELYFVPIKKLPAGFIKKTTEAIFPKAFIPTKDQPDVRKERIRRDIEVDYTDAFIESLFITNSDENPDLFYLSDRSSDSQHDNRRIIRTQDGKKIYFNAYGFLQSYKQYEKQVTTVQKQKEIARKKQAPASRFGEFAPVPGGEMTFAEFLRNQTR
jgi:hypothetical protein